MTHSQIVNIRSIDYVCEFELNTDGDINEVLLTYAEDTDTGLEVLEGSDTWYSIERELQLSADDFAQEEKENAIENSFNREEDYE